MSIMGVLTMIIVLVSRQLSKLTQEVFYGYVDLKKKRVGYPSVISFEDGSASGSQEARDLFGEFIERTYVYDSWVQVESRAGSFE
jgi:hypothetical protein